MSNIGSIIYRVHLKSHRLMRIAFLLREKDVKNPHTMQILTAVFDSRKWCIEGRNPWPLVQ